MFLLRTHIGAFSGRRWHSVLSYVHCPGEQPLSPWTIGRLVDEAAKRWSEREAVISVHQQSRLTFAQLRDQVTCLGAGFARLGLQPGAHLGIWASNCIEWELTQLAAAKAGLVLVNVNPALEANELRHCLQTGAINALVAGHSFRGRRLHEILQLAIPDLQFDGKTDGRVRSKSIQHLSHVVSIGAETPPKHLRFDDLIEDNDLASAESTLRPLEFDIQCDDGCNIQFTSGTTGNPKAAMLSHHGILNNSFVMGKRLGYMDKVYRICMPNPLFHCFGCVAGTLASLHFGATIVMPAAIHSASQNIHAIQEHRCNAVYGTPTMHVDLLTEARRQGVGNELGIELVVTGGALTPESLFHELKQQFSVELVSSVYGMTECSPVTFQTLRSDPLALQATMAGRISEHWEARVVDSKGRTMPLGEPGELWVRGYGTLLKYWGNPGATAALLRPDGWLATGDQFVLEADGFGRVVGRIKDMILRGGENIYPREVEDALHTHPDVLEAQVYGVPDKRLGEVVCASVRLRPNTSVTAQQLREFCRGKIAQFKIPLHLQIVDTFPRTPSGFLLLVQSDGPTERETGWQELLNSTDDASESDVTTALTSAAVSELPHEGDLTEDIIAYDDVGHPDNPSGDDLPSHPPGEQLNPADKNEHDTGKIINEGEQQHETGNQTMSGR